MSSVSLVAGAPIERAIEAVNKVIIDDSTVPDFFENISKKELPYYSTYQKCDTGSLSGVSPLPPDVVSEGTGKLGYLPEIDRFYSLNREKLYLWKPGESTTNLYTEKGITIHSVSTLLPDPTFFDKKVTSFLAVGTTTFIKLFPIIDDEIKFEFNYIENINFVPFSMSPGSDHSILIGTQKGEIHILYFEDGESFKDVFIDTILFKQSRVSPKIKIFNATATILSRITPKFLKFSLNAIINIVYDPTTRYVCAIDDKSNLTFYMATEFYTLTLVSSFSSGKRQIVSVSPVPLSDSSDIRFVAFDSKGERLFFGFSRRILGYSKGIRLLSTRKPPSEAGGFAVVSGVYVLGYTLLLQADTIILMYANDDFEFVSYFKSYGTGVAAITPRHAFDHLEHTRLFALPRLWQHAIPAPRVPLLTTSGSAEVQLCEPAMFLRRALLESHGAVSEEVSVALKDQPAGDIGASCLLLQQRTPEAAQMAGGIAMLFNRFVKDCGIVDAFTRRAARAAAIVWNSSAFVKIEESLINSAFKSHFQVAPVFKRMPPELMQNLKGVAAEVRSLLQSPEASTLTTGELSDLAELAELVDLLVEVTRFIALIGTQRKVHIDAAVRDLSLRARWRLTKKPIAADGAMPIVDALLEFRTSFFKELGQSAAADLLAAQIAAECPRVSLTGRAHLQAAEEELAAAAALTGKDREVAVSRAVAAFSGVDAGPHDIAYVCNRLVALGFPVVAVSVANQCAMKLDPEGRALKWFQAGCVEGNTKGRRAFIQAHACFEAASAAVFKDEGLRAVIDTGSPLFVYTALETLYLAREYDRLIAADTPLLEDYIRDNAPELLWLLLDRRGQTKEAAAELIKLASDTLNVKMEDRLRHLRTAVKVAQRGRHGEELREAENLLAAAEIQAEIVKRTGELNGPIQNFRALRRAVVQHALYDLEFAIATREPHADEEERHDAFMRAWQNFAGALPPSADNARASVVRLFAALPTKAACLRPALAAAVLEDVRVMHKFAPMWAAQTLVDAGCNRKELFGTYLEFLSNIADSAADKNAIVCSLLWMASVHVGSRQDIPEAAIREALSDTAAPFYNDVKSLVEA